MKKLISIVILFLSISNAYAVLEEESIKKLVDTKQLTLTTEEFKILNEGELGTTRYVIGGVVGTGIGLGLGHAIEGRWSEMGWIFTTGELALSYLTATTAASCILSFGRHEKSCDNMALAYGGYYALRVWEAVDVWRGGYIKKTNYENLSNKVEGEIKAAPKSTLNISPMLSSKLVGFNLLYTF